MKKVRRVLTTCLMVFALAGSAYAMQAVAVSPGSDTGAAVIGQGCPTFSWSGVPGAVSYEAEVFEAETVDVLLYDDMAIMAGPVLSVLIPAPALSWTPASGNCLMSGNAYVWYVRGTDVDGEGEWSVGRVFEVDVTAGFEDFEDKIERTVEDYLVREKVRSGYSQTGTDSEVIRTEKSAGSFLNIPYARLEGTEGDTNTFYGNGTGENNSGINNTFIGSRAGYYNNGDDNTMIGREVGYWNSNGSGNVFLGYRAGYNDTGSNRLYIDNSAASRPLIYGEFNNDILDVNGQLHVAADDGPLPSVSPHTDAIVSNTSAGSDRAYLSLIAGSTTGISRINFGDTDQENVGFFSYSHSNNSMQVRAGGIEVMRFVNNKMSIGGEVSPDSTLSIKGNTAIGAAYSGSVAGPPNGMIIQGNVGIGTSNPQSTLHVNGYVQLALTSGIPPASDCDETPERGRMKVDNAAGILYVCVNSGWVAK